MCKIPSPAVVLTIISSNHPKEEIFHDSPKEIPADSAVASGQYLQALGEKIPSL